MGHKVEKVEFPNYASPSSALVKMYLKGDFGSDPGDVNPYAASSFYAVDRFASFNTEWKQFYNAGSIILADRYVTSNLIHQAVKIENAEERQRFLNWLWDLEYNKFELPLPDAVVFLDVPPEFSTALISHRANKSGADERDIHEGNREHLNKAYHNACAIADKYQWHRVNCVREGLLLSIEEIHEKIFQVIGHLIG